MPGKLVTSETTSLATKPVTKEDVAKSTFGSGSFGDAIRHLKAGGKVKRGCWPSKLHVYLKEDILYKQGTGDAFVYDALHADLLAKDWSSYA